MIFEFNLKFFFVKIIFLSLFIFQSEVIASSKLDCKEKAFYVNNVISDAKHKNLTKAKMISISPLTAQALPSLLRLL